jgi:hypothetical protein
MSKDDPHPRSCRIEWSDGRVFSCASYEDAKEWILHEHPHAVIESDNGDVDQVLAWRDARTAGMPDSAVAVIRFGEASDDAD